MTRRRMMPKDDAARLVFDGITALYAAVEAAQEAGLSLEMFLASARSAWQQREVERVIGERLRPKP